MSSIQAENMSESLLYIQCLYLQNKSLGTYNQMFPTLSSLIPSCTISINDILTLLQQTKLNDGKNV